MKKSLALLIVAIAIFVWDLAAFLLGSPYILITLLFYVAFFLAIVAVYLKLDEVGQKRA